MAKEQPKAKADMDKVTTVGGAAAAISSALNGRSTDARTPKGMRCLLPSPPSSTTCG